jgi:hypothetical protein
MSVRRSESSHSEKVLRYCTVVFILLLFRRHLWGDLGNKSNARAGGLPYCINKRLTPIHYCIVPASKRLSCRMQCPTELLYCWRPAMRNACRVHSSSHVTYYYSPLTASDCGSCTAHKNSMVRLLYVIFPIPKISSRIFLGGHHSPRR